MLREAEETFELDSQQLDGDHRRLEEMVAGLNRELNDRRKRIVCFTAECLKKKERNINN
jgi:hypothetical protein